MQPEPSARRVPIRSAGLEVRASDPRRKDGLNALRYPPRAEGVNLPGSVGDAETGLALPEGRIRLFLRNAPVALACAVTTALFRYAADRSRAS